MRAFGWFLGAILLAGLIGALLAYPAYELTASFANWPFHRVAGRIAELVLAAVLIALCRHLDFKRRGDFGYGLPWRRFLAVSLRFGVVGLATAGVGAAFLLITRLRAVDPAFVPAAASLAHIFFVGLGSGIAVALLEETVFRGVMHTAIERESGAWTAALLTAPLFAVLHFTAKARIDAADLGWGSGFDLLQRSFAPLGHPALVFDSFLSWVVVGLILSLTRALTGNIAVAIGLHGGWVVVLRMLQQGTTGGAAAAGGIAAAGSSTSAYSAWVGRFDGLLGYWMLPWGIAIGAALWFTRSSWVAYASAEGPQSLVSGLKTSSL
jgi:membrane protease YdiL (CAAX protease family)